ncbi:MAG: hypothetical protein AAFY25_10925 [Pseudomonadota bacterium]
MDFPSLNALLSTGQALLAKGPVALIFVEDEVEVDSTLRHHVDLQFSQVFAFMPEAFVLAPDVAERVHRVGFDVTRGDSYIRVVNRMIQAVPGLWLYYCFNAEYLFYPFCETRSVGELLTFHSEERREAMLTYVIDIYAKDLDQNRNGVSLENAHLDRSGYYALARKKRPDSDDPQERQLDFFGGLRWRYEEHVPQDKRKIDRIALFRAKQDLILRGNHTFSDEEYNTFACPWHNNLTGAIMSFRTAKALKTNPGSTFDIYNFCWHNTAPFEWHSRQLLDLGLMEPGQWF